VIEQTDKKYVGRWSPVRPPDGLPELTAGRWRHFLGTAGPLVLPPVFLIVWLVVLVLALFGKR
jgi:hypothetical protein